MFVKWANYRDSLMEGDAISMATVVILFKVLFTFLVSIPILLAGLGGTLQGMSFMLASLAYSVGWGIKFLRFPDKTFDRTISWMGVFYMVTTVILPYLLIPWVWVLAPVVLHPAITGFGLFMSLYGTGLNLYADYHKFGATSLVTDGPFHTSRHPNYGGMFLTHAGMCVLAGCWLPWVLLGWVWLALMYPNLVRLEDHMSSKYGATWRLYTVRSNFL